MTTPPPPRQHAYTSIQPIRWGDMDALGHVNNTVYFRFMEQARVEWMEKIGMALTPELTEGIVIINAECTFLKQLTYPGQVAVQMDYGSIGTSSIMSYYQLRLVGENTLYAEGAAKMVWVNFALGKSAPLPEKIRQHLPGAWIKA